MTTQTSQQIAQLESNITSLESNLAAVKAEKDQQKAGQEELHRTSQRLGKELEQLKSENAMLEMQAQEAESRITVLLDQVNERVGNYRRQSQLQPLAHGINGLGHNREESTSTMTDVSVNDDTPTHDDRGSVALDNLASELETLRSQWENTSRSTYRLSAHSERTPTAETHGNELSDNLASWRRRLAEEENGSRESSTAA
jgi:DNA repair exonuclease SbcCD ATPase subunit